MKDKRNMYRKFLPKQKTIEELELKNDRFRRIYAEYESFSRELSNLESADAPAVPDDFMDAVKLQTSILEDEVEYWLTENHSKTDTI